MPKSSSPNSSPTPLRRYALTGGIGSGKSTVASLFVELGAFLVDADAISRSLMEPGQPVLERTVAEFGRHLLDPSGRLNRPALAKIVFSDPSARQRLNSIVHPAVRDQAAQLVEQAQTQPGFSGIVLEDIPLLVESGNPASFDGVIVVTAPLDIRLQRLTEARGMKESDAHARIAAQATDAQREAVATWTINNGGSLEETAEQVRTVWEHLTSS